MRAHLLTGVNASGAWVGVAPLIATLKKETPRIFRVDVCSRAIHNFQPSALRLLGFCDGLWQGDCIEAFFGTSDGKYLECNLSPKGYFAYYAFDAYRTFAKLPPLISPILDAYWIDEGLGFWVQLPFEPICYQLSAVQITKKIGGLQYFASTHQGAPDFHNQALWHRF